MTDLIQENKELKALLEAKIDDPIYEALPKKMKEVIQDKYNSYADGIDLEEVQTVDNFILGLIDTGIDYL